MGFINIRFEISNEFVIFKIQENMLWEFTKLLKSNSALCPACVSGHLKGGALELSISGIFKADGDARELPRSCAGDLVPFRGGAI